jgi:threonine/homoserine/homoserine lactone efflux protein
LSIEFLVTSLIVVASPGTGVLYTLAAGLSRGARASFVAAFGCTLGIVPHMVAAVMGLAAVLHTSAVAFQTLKYLGVAYLLYMAWSTLQEGGALSVDREESPRSAAQVVVHAILINVLNPKLSIFFLAFLPQFTDHTRGPIAPQILLLGVIWIALGMASDGAFALLASAMAGRLRRSARARRRLDVTSGVVYLGLGAVAAFTGESAMAKT